MKIRQKLVLLVVIPLIAVLAFATLAVVTTGNEALQADRLRGMVVSNAAAGELMSALQTERSSAVRTLVDPEHSSPDEFLQDASATDDVIEDYRDARKDLTSLPDGTVENLDRIDSALNNLEATRERIFKGEKTASASAFAYRILIADLQGFRESVPQAGGAPSDVADRIRASNILSQLAEHVSIEDEAVQRAFVQNELTAASQQEITAARSGITEAMSSFKALAPAEWLSEFERTQSGQEMMDAQVLEDQAVRATPGQTLDIPRDEWAAGMELRASNLKEVQESVDESVVREITDLRNEQLWWTGGQVAAVLLAVLTALIMATRLGGPVVRGLRKLATTAHNVATEGLPNAVARLDDHEVLGGRTPDEFAKDETPPIEVKGKDELADVGRAFNEVHQEAIRVAAAQALLRLHIASMFVRLARRGHSLAGRLTNVLDEAERNEDDPDRLERLFALDHLVTLFGRTNDSLLVLGGAAPAKVRRANETVTNVLTAAQGQIEQYKRVQVEAADENLAIKAEAVDDLVKLLAELLDNSTEYSQHQVNMFARLLADRLIVQINDRGIGIRPEILESLNNRLASKSALDLNSVQTMGLTVVGHLAARHGITVELRQAPTGGTLAEVSLPAELLESPAAPKALPSSSGEPQGDKPTKRRAALFDKKNKGNNRRQKTENNRRAQRDKAVPAVAQGPPSPEGREPVSSEALGAMGLPIIQFDMDKNQAPSDGAAEPSAPPAPPARAEPQPPVETQPRRPRLFSTEKAKEPRVPEDPGWSAAKSAVSSSHETPPAAREGGLPKRQPMAQLVPGAMEASEAEQPTAEANPAFRNPNSVSATYVAYARARTGAGRPKSPSPDSSRDPM